jgi:hypothetical protein
MRIDDQDTRAGLFTFMESGLFLWRGIEEKRAPQPEGQAGRSQEVFVSTDEILTRPGQESS